LSIANAPTFNFDGLVNASLQINLAPCPPTKVNLLFGVMVFYSYIH